MAIKQENDYGWSTPPQEVKKTYRETCLSLATDDEKFANFRRDPDYAKILEGFDKDVANGAMVDLNYLDKQDDFFARFADFQKNDMVGNPHLLQLEGGGYMAPNTVRYAAIAYEIKAFVPDAKRIIEIGGGYGGQARILSEFYDFDEYIIVDLPEALELTKRYLSHFPFFHKMKFLAPDEVTEMGKFDLFIADASLSECDGRTQLTYLNTFAIYSKYLFILYNTLHLEKSRIAFIGLVINLVMYSIRFSKVHTPQWRTMDSITKIKATRVWS